MRPISDLRLKAIRWITLNETKRRIKSSIKHGVGLPSPGWTAKYASKRRHSHKSRQTKYSGALLQGSNGEAGRREVAAASRAEAENAPQSPSPLCIRIKKREFGCDKEQFNGLASGGPRFFLLDTAEEERRGEPKEAPPPKSTRYNFAHRRCSGVRLLCTVPNSVVMCDAYSDSSS
ncbi:hypothetical protein HPB50_023087 [Hyalomma asiaticum]|uniref:Uncharacterized protein n=1 Tax=Hyalomma asiaticum TaxID=266040 RepID=A0ACB7TKP9_HYAAI|nr:hypothetical protein HPB50_023087 [Hyalomma asiaticum]